MSVQVADLVATLSGRDQGFSALMATAALRMGNLHLSMSGAAEGVGLLGVALAGLSAGALASAVKQAADFQSLIQTWANNAGLGAAGALAMANAVKQTAAATGQSFDSLSQGYSTITSHGFNAAQSLNVLTVAARNAAATGGDAYQNAYVLSGILREYGANGMVAANSLQSVTRVMDTLHAAVTNSAWSMNQFVEGSKKAIGIASQYDVPLQDVTAQLAVLSQHGFGTAQLAATAWAGMVTRLAAPTAAARIEFEKLHHSTGVDLPGDIKKLQQNGAFLPQFLADIKLAASKTGMSMNQFISSDLVALMPQQAYRRALAALLKNNDEVIATTQKTSAAALGQMKNGTDEAFAAQQKTLNGQLADLHASFNVLAVDIGSVFIPVLSRAAGALLPFVQTLTTRGLGPALASLRDDITGAVTRVDWGQVGRNAVTGLHTVFLTMQSWLQNTGIPFLQGRLTDITVAFQHIDWAGIGKTITGALGNLKDKVPVVLSAAWTWASTTATDLKAWLDTHGDEIKKDVSQKVSATVQAVTIGLKATWAWAQPMLVKLSDWIGQHLHEIAPGVAAFAGAYAKTGNIVLATIAGAIAIAVTYQWANISGKVGPLQTWISTHIGELLSAEAGTAALLMLRGMPVLRTISGIIALAAAFGWAKTAGPGKLQDWVNQNAGSLILGGGVSLAVLLATKNPQLAAISGSIVVTASYAWDRPDGKPSDLATWVNAQLKRSTGKAIDALDIFSAIGAAVDDPKNDAKFQAWLGGWSKSLSEQFSGAIGGAMSGAASAVSGAFSGVPQAIYDYLAGRVKDVSSVKDEITHYFSDAGTWLKDAGGRLIKGLWDGMTNNPFFQKIEDFFSQLTRFGKYLGVSYSGGSVSGMPTAYSGPGFGASGAVQVTVNAGAITVTGLGTPADNAGAASAIGTALGEFTRQMVQAQRGVGNTVRQSIPGAV